MTNRFTVRWVAMILACGLLAGTQLLQTGTAIADTLQPDSVQVAQGTERQPRDLEPRYQPAPPQEKGWYNDEYIFAATKAVGNSTMAPAAKVSLYPLTVLFDLVLLPFATIGGFFG